MEAFARTISTIDGWLWGPWLLILLFGTHLYLTVRTGFIQKKLGLAIRLSVTKDKGGEGDVSQFGALTTALASTIGTGNIIGVGTAIAVGGPGAVLWMWLTGVFGIATKYSESLIAVKYRVKTEKGTMLGGAMFALERGLKNKKLGRFLGILFAVFAALAAFGIGDGVQSNAVADLVQRNFHIPAWISGLIMMVFTGLVLVGGLKAISKVCESLVPFMAAVYTLGCIICLIMNAQYVGPAFVAIWNAAFAPRALTGGLLGYGLMAAARFGIARGLFSNESGMGSAPIVASAAKTANPVRQALVSMTGTFWDTVVVCLMTGLVIVSYEVAPNGSTGFTNGGALTNEAFSQIPVFGPIILTFGLITFAFSTILGWSYYGEKGAEYLFGSKINIPYRILYTLIVFVGAAIPLGLVWDIADALNALMILPNILAVLLLSNIIVEETKKYSGIHIDDVDTTPIPLMESLRRKNPV
ncbi:sodium:alanine symporter family protein [Treponema primitia ZAS-2]|uniref:Sodium:alanine symporter family protein n=1 Tax=Treponema primitia (strain ATCC BAA-887 / DSM 12427 / ZAS-2) TaxID=545694 RepID=F5YIB1_TREPZ|nr:sodium:alanine symporter family protein [Treponema primitia]AEF84898.1 sodium:alanine symporter family protein [Treponema primitia ZAS-2]